MRLGQRKRAVHSRRVLKYLARGRARVREQIVTFPSWLRLLLLAFGGFLCQRGQLELFRADGQRRGLDIWPQSRAHAPENLLGRVLWRRAAHACC